MSAQPGRDLSLCWEQHRKLLPGVTRETAETVQHWSIQQVRETDRLPHQRPLNCLSVSNLSLSLQVADFIESLPGCEEQSKQFRDEVRRPISCSRFITSH